MPTANLDDIESSANVARMDDIVGHDATPAEPTSKVSQLIHNIPASLGRVAANAGTLSGLPNQEELKPGHTNPDSPNYIPFSTAEHFMGDLKHLKDRVSHFLDNPVENTIDAFVQDPAVMALSGAAMLRHGGGLAADAAAPAAAKVAELAANPEVRAAAGDLAKSVPLVKNAQQAAKAIHRINEVISSKPSQAQPITAGAAATMPDVRANSILPKVPTFQDLPAANPAIPEQAPAPAFQAPPSVQPMVPQFQDLPEAPARTAPAAPAPLPAAPDVDLLNQISRKLTKGKQNYNSLDANGKALVDRFAASAAPAPAVPPVPVTQAAAQPQPIFQEAAQAAQSPVAALPPSSATPLPTLPAKASVPGPPGVRLFTTPTNTGGVRVIAVDEAKQTQGYKDFDPIDRRNADLHKLEPGKVSAHVGDDWKDQIAQEGYDPKHVVGTVDFHPGADSTLHTGQAYVAPDFRRQGVASAMYDLAKQRTGSANILPGVQSADGRAFRQAYDQPTGISSNLPAKAIPAAQALAKELTGQEGPITLKPNEAGAPADSNPPSSAYEEAARDRKATKLADAFSEHGFHPDDVRRIDPSAISGQDWMKLLGRSEMTGEQHWAPSKQTLSQAADELERRAAQAKGAASDAARKAKADAAQRAFARELGWEDGKPPSVGSLMNR